MRWKPSGIGTGLGGNDEALSLAQTLFDSLGRMAERVCVGRVALSPRASSGVGKTRYSSEPAEASELRRGGSGDEYDADNGKDNGSGGVAPPSRDQAEEDCLYGDGTADAMVATSTSRESTEEKQKEEDGDDDDETRTARGATAGVLRGLRVRWLEDETVEGSNTSEGEDGKNDGNKAEKDWHWVGDDDPCKAGSDGGEGEEEAKRNGLFAETKSASPRSVPLLEQPVDERNSDVDFADCDDSADGSARTLESKTSDHHKTRRPGSSEGADTAYEVDGEPSGQKERPPSSSWTIGTTAEAEPEAKDNHSHDRDHSKRKQTESPHSNDNSSASANGLNEGSDNALGSGGGGTRGPADHNRGFFLGTAQLALAPDAMLRQALHPALAPPSLPGLDHDPRDPFLRRRNLRVGREAAPSRGAHAADSNTPVVGDTDRRPITKIGGVDAAAATAGTELAAAAEDVAEVLPPVMVLELCLLAPLREHCRLASSSCLGVFVDELGLTTIAGAAKLFWVWLVGVVGLDTALCACCCFVVLVRLCTVQVLLLSDVGRVNSCAPSPVFVRVRGGFFFARSLFPLPPFLFFFFCEIDSTVPDSLCTLTRGTRIPSRTVHMLSLSL